MALHVQHPLFVPGHLESNPTRSVPSPSPHLHGTGANGCQLYSKCALLSKPIWDVIQTKMLLMLEGALTFAHANFVFWFNL